VLFTIAVNNEQDRIWATLANDLIVYCLSSDSIMAVDYDLIIVGNTIMACSAAQMAASWSARVGLVLPSATIMEPSRGVQTLLTLMGQQAGQLKESLLLASTIRQYQGTLELVQQELVPALQQSGVDVIVGTGQFLNRHRLAFAVHDRYLSARAYLLAIASSTKIPAIAGLQDVNYLTLETLASQLQNHQFSAALITHPKHWLILGDDPVGVEIAQTLKRLGKTVTLVTAGRLLPAEDVDVVRLLQAQLEAEGVDVVTHASVQQIKQDGNQVEVALDLPDIQLTIAADVLFLATERVPQFQHLGLEAAGIQSSQSLTLNRRLQTTHPQIYACGNVMGGYALTELANFEATIALKNALFCPIFPVNYQVVPWTIATDPPVARLGFTETQARKRFGNRIRIVHGTKFQNLTSILPGGQALELCKIILHSNGQILGAHLIGTDAPELMTTLALACQKRLAFGAIAHLFPISGTQSENLVDAAVAWKNQQIANSRLQDWLEGFFYWQRSKIR
jgi:pyruvate/2-oxoglutarate dehydrogenase complex dihydrolipoamide dehydrogenase (E3) component